MQRISVVSLPVSDQERAKDFYQDQVGFELVADATFGEGMRWVQLAPSGGGTTITLVTWFAEMPPGSLRGLVLDTDDVQADYRAMSERGVAFLGPPSEQPGGVFATFIDPDGNQIGLHQA